VYLHFGSRARFLLELTEGMGAGEVVQRADVLLAQAPTAAAALRALIELRDSHARRHRTVIAAFRAAMYGDPDVHRIWTARQRRRFRYVQRVAERMRREGVLRRDLPVADAAAFIWATLSFENWYHLVEVHGWSSKRYVSRMYQLLSRAVGPGGGRRVRRLES
jgi:AcrR family transcriptional regulator